MDNPICQRIKKGSMPRIKELNPILADPKYCRAKARGSALLWKAKAMADLLPPAQRPAVMAAARAEAARILAEVVDARKARRKRHGQRYWEKASDKEVRAEARRDLKWLRRTTKPVWEPSPPELEMSEDEAMERRLDPWAFVRKDAARKAAETKARRRAAKAAAEWPLVDGADA